MSFTKTGQPIQGRKYTISQGDVVIPGTVVGKLFGRGGSADLIGIIFKEEGGGRGRLPWPLEAEPGTEPIHFTSGWQTEESA